MSEQSPWDAPMARLAEAEAKSARREETGDQKAAGEKSDRDRSQSDEGRSQPEKAKAQAREGTRTETTADSSAARPHGTPKMEEDRRDRSRPRDQSRPRDRNRPQERPPAGRKPQAATRQSSADPPPRALALAAMDEIELMIDKLVAGGDGFGRYEGIPIFVPLSAPGDVLRVKLVDRQADYGRGEILEVLTAGAGRREPPCPHFTRCGGCDLQHLEESRQVELKAGAVRETLKRLGGIDLPKQTEILAGKPWGYRVRTQVHSQVSEDGRVSIGYHRRGSNELVPIDQCRVLVPELEAMVPHLPAMIPVEGPRRLDLLAGREGVSAAPPIRQLPSGETTIRVGEFDYSLDARCFFQAHRTLTPALVDRAVGAWTGDLAFDLYAGVGLLTLPLARRYRRVVAVEGAAISARFARKNAKKYGFDGVEVDARAVESCLKSGLPDGIDRLVVDPPRSGLSAGVRKAILRSRVPRLTYVSCHPATLARDLKQLTSEYTIESMVLLDLFPQSGHMEVIAQLSMKADA